MITKEKFEAFEKVRESGITNMFIIKNVVLYAKTLANVVLDKEEVVEIIKNYDKYRKAKNFLEIDFSEELDIVNERAANDEGR